jgi:hypothetical protein
MKQTSKGSSIFISNDFLKQYPQHVDHIVDSFLQKNEKCVDRHPKQMNDTPQQSLPAKRAY